MADATRDSLHRREGSIGSLFGPLSPEESAPNIRQSLSNKDTSMPLPGDSLMEEDISDDQVLHDALQEALSAPNVTPKPQNAPGNIYRPPRAANSSNTTAVKTTGHAVSPYIMTPPSTMPEGGELRNRPITPDQNGPETGSAYSDAARAYINRSRAAPSSTLSRSSHLAGYFSGAQLSRGPSTTPLPTRVPLIDYSSDESGGEEKLQCQPSPPSIQGTPADDLERSQKTKGHRDPPAQRNAPYKPPRETAASPANQKVKESQPTRKLLTTRL